MLDRYRLPCWLAVQTRLQVPVLAVESDDWGHDCAAARDGKQGHDMWLHDRRETPAEVLHLADTLRGIRDLAGRAPVVTLNWIVHQPDFAAIAASGYASYRSHALDDRASLEAACSGAANEQVFEFGLHGAEHLNPAVWLARLRAGDQRLRAIFDNARVPSPALYRDYPGLGAAYLEAPSTPDVSVARANDRLTRAFDSFGQLLGTPPAAFTPPNHCWDDPLAAHAAQLGIAYLQATEVRYATFADCVAGRYRRSRHDRSGPGGLGLCTRTVRFEPRVHADAGERALALASALIERRIPVVLSTHRVNYLSADDERGAVALRDLLRGLLNRHPALRFVSSASLFELGRSGRWDGIGRASRMQTLIRRVGEFALDAARVSLDKDYFGAAAAAE